MNELTRRGFLTNTSIGITAAVLAGGAVSLPRMMGGGAAPDPGQAGAPQHLIAHVRDLSTGEMSLMAGTNEVIHRDRELASKLMRVALTGQAR